MSPFESLVPRSEAVSGGTSPGVQPPCRLTPAASLPLPTATTPGADATGTPPPQSGPFDAAVEATDLTGLAAGAVPRGGRRRRGRRLVQPEHKPAPLTPQQRLLLLDTWQRSGLPAGDFA